MESQKQIQIFNNAEFGEIRSMEIGGEPWFVGWNCWGNEV